VSSGWRGGRGWPGSRGNRYLVHSLLILRCQLGEWPWGTAATSGSCGHGGRSSTWPQEDDGQ
jgi:hypothetical protein